MCGIPWAFVKMLLGERLNAYIAAKRLLSRMDNLMMLESPLGGERLITDVARVHRCYSSLDALAQWRLRTVLCSSTR